MGRQAGTEEEEKREREREMWGLNTQGGNYTQVSSGGVSRSGVTAGTLSSVLN